MANSLNILFVNQTGLPDSQVFITFQDPSQTLNVSYNGQTLGRNKAGDMMTQSLSLETITADGLHVYNARGPVVFVSFEATMAHDGFSMDADLSGNAQPSFIGSGGANYFKAYQPFEINYEGSETNGQGNLTNINYFGAALSIQSYHGGVSGELLQTRGNTDTQSMSKRLGSLVNGPNSELAAISNHGKMLRYIGPSSFGAGSNPYPSFDAYLDYLCSNSITSQIENNNAFNTMTSPAVGNLNYNYTLKFLATVSADRTITLAGEITTTITPFGGTSSPGKTYTGASMTISPTIGSHTSAAIFNNTIYGQADPLGPGKGSTVFNSIWAELANDMANLGLCLNKVPGTTYTTTQSLAIGEITTGLLGGFVGSDLAYFAGDPAYQRYDKSAYKSIPSAAWWNAKTVPSPSALQPAHPYYSSYSEVIFDATSNEVYSIPFSDRFGQGPLMQTQLYNGKVVDTWVVTIGRPLFNLS